MSKFLQNPYAEYTLHDQIIHFSFKKDIEIDLNAAEQIVKDRISLQGGKPFPVLCDLRSIKYVTKPARDYMAADGTVLISAVAFVVEPTLPSDVVINMFLRSNKPAVTNQIFTNEKDALSFLKGFVS